MLTIARRPLPYIVSLVLLLGLFSLPAKTKVQFHSGSASGAVPALEMAHVLFMDIVAYSKLLMDQQRGLL